MNPDIYGGAPLLGLNGNVVKIHGSARRVALKHAILQCSRAVNSQLGDLIVREIGRVRGLVQPSNPSTATAGDPH